MIRLALVALAALTLAACGTQTGDRIASGAALGAGTGIILGPVGVGAGALVGGAVGLLTPPEKVNLGEPVWNK
jgi:osmotically inducible lipoprotein OsmB